MYCLHHVFGSRQNVIVSESQHSITGRFKIGGTLGVMPRLLLMLTAINLDDYPSFQAYEIGDVWT
jgi:hypothetical protein